MAPGKRKRDPLEGFDPNQSDPEDENFDPSEARPRRQKKALRATRKAGGRTRTNRYRGSDIDEDDEELSDSIGEDSFGGDDSEVEDDEVPVNASGRRARKAAVHHPSYREESEEDIVNDSVVNTDADEEEPPKPKPQDEPVEEPAEEADADADVVEDSAPEAAANQGEAEDEPNPVQGDIVMDEAGGTAPQEQAAEEDSDDVLTGRRMTRSSRQGNVAPAADDGDDESDEEEEPAPAAATPGRRKRGNGGGGDRYLNTTYGPFGGAGGLGSLLGGPWGTGAAGGVDSDSSDDELGARYGVPGAVGVTPTAAAGPGLPQGAANTHLESLGIGATPNVGKVKNQKALADADPLGVDMNVDFNQVGGLAGHINQLKEMVQLPLLYPEVFQQFHVTPPRGVLFHGPPGTGKTLLARALANSIGSGGRKITFYMRKGADALSKWVGEAEKQLRLLFEEARKTQPSIIFFDEIDGLAPVRSSKQEQIHASIVSTLLALMDGMDGRGQVIVIGATNRPDNIDPALRRPGRFDREFYFPLPDVDGRNAILDIHTKDWGLTPEFKKSLAENTKGYGGADLRALCTEAALNAIQRTYPQIYSSEQKLVVDPSKISIHATDFMISIKKMVPSSERSASSGAAPLPKAVAPLLREQFAAIEETVKTILPLKPKITALEEAIPRLLIAGQPGMGQNYIASAILHHFERVHVQRCDLATILGDGRPPEQVITGMFSEVKRHKPSVVYIPHVDTWYATLGATALKVLTTMLMDIPPYEPVLLFGTADCEASELDRELLRALFPFSRKNRVEIARPNSDNRMEFFSNMAMHVKKSPSEFPDPSTRKKRVLEELPVAPPPPPKPKSKAEIKSELKRDRQLLNHLKMRLQPVMDQLKKGKYRVFYKPMIPYDRIRYLFEEADPNYVSPDVPQHRPYIISKDSHGTEGLLEVDTGKFYYNLELITIEERLSNGYYARPKDFYRDIKTLVHDSKNMGDKDKILKSNEMESNVDVDMGEIENALGGPGPWEALHERQLRRAAEAAEKAKKKAAMRSAIGMIEDSESQVGPVRIGAPVPPESTTLARFRVMSPEERDEAGDSHMSNGNSVPSRLAEGGSDEATQPFSQMGPPPVVQQRSSTTVSVRNAAGETQVSQVSALTSLPQGVSPSAVLNEASTTNDPSTNKSSSNWSTQATNGFHGDMETNSQLPDTQPPGDHLSGPSQQTGSSHSPWMHSQADALAHGKLSNVVYGASNLQTSPTSSQVPTDRRVSRIGLPNLLNDPVSVSDHSSVRNSGGSTSSSQHMPVVHDGQVQQFLNDLTERTSGCTIEQLEQINRELMDHIWLSRHEWNRMKVLNQLVKIFNDTISDIEEMQGVGQSSQELNDERAREYYSGSSRH
ncbi:putative aaa family [Diaporthe ampelina]|uniref:Putative aaa family n=1 Tax=Diaporthe ampelina TaxID=1214573 RepID=A0A0G2I149_9PEZI|nr:putative aaa family [Diaporthe ampelina]